MVDQRFTQYPFQAAGVYDYYHNHTTGSRTMPDRLDDVVNVKDWGTAGDGITDDTAAIQAALAHASSLRRTHGAIVYFPRGTYLIKNPPLYLDRDWFAQPPPGHVKIIGEGRDVTKITGTHWTGNQSFSRNNGFLVQCGIWGANQVSSISNLTIEN